MDILWSLVFIQTYKLIFFLFLLVVLIWCQSGEIVFGQADFSSPPDRLSCKVWKTFVISVASLCNNVLVKEMFMFTNDTKFTIYFFYFSTKISIKNYLSLDFGSARRHFSLCGLHMPWLIPYLGHK